MQMINALVKIQHKNKRHAISDPQLQILGRSADPADPAFPTPESSALTTMLSSHTVGLTTDKKLVIILCLTGSSS